MFFSIIIPIYNGLSHGLPTCLESIWNQPLDGAIYEVICVDDCSTDQTRNWLTEHTKVHSNLRVIFNEENLRQGGSRNKGIRVARGKYIVFIDQDDYYHHDALARTYEHLKNSDLQILIVDCAYQYFGKESNKLQHNFPHHEIMTGDQIIACNSIPYAPWKFIIERGFIVEKDLFFIEHERGEDIDWVHYVVHHAVRVQYQPILFIHYNKSNDSTTMSAYYSLESAYSGLRMSARLYQLAIHSFTANAVVQKYILSLFEKCCAGSLKFFFFTYDDILLKKEQIHKLKVSVGEKYIVKSKIIKFAFSHTLLFCFFSNIISPFGRLIVIIYRWYRTRQ